MYTDLTKILQNCQILEHQDGTLIVSDTNDNDTNTQTKEIKDGIQSEHQRSSE